MFINEFYDNMFWKACRVMRGVSRNGHSYLEYNYNIRDWVRLETWVGPAGIERGMRHVRSGGGKDGRDLATDVGG